MFCPKCGSPLPDDAAFCGYCGEQFGKKGRKKAAGAPKQPRVKDPEKSKRVKRNVIITAIAMILCAGLAAAAAYFIPIFIEQGSNAPKKEEKPAEEKVTDPQYNLDIIVKKAPDLSKLAGAAGSDAEVQQVNAEISAVKQVIAEAERAYAENYPEDAVITTDNIYYHLNTVTNSLYDLYREDVIDGYERNDTSVRIDLNSGGSYIYAPEMSGYDAGEGGVPDTAVPQLKIATYQPCLSGYPSSIGSYLTKVDDGAALVDSTFPVTYNFFKDNTGNDDDYNDGEVSPAAVSGFGAFNLILWHGHGCCDDNYGSLLVIGIERSAENDKKFKRALDNHEMFYGESCYFISSKFIDNYIEDGSLDNSIIYLGACSSGEDRRLAESFLNKGAEAVYANSDTIHTTYNLSMIYSVAEGLCKKYSTGGNYTVSDALDYAKEQNGERDTGDCSYTQVLLYSENPSFALDWYEDYRITDRDIVLVLDNSGSMSGTPLDETKKAAVEFVQTVLGGEESASIAVVSYSDYAKIVSGFSSRESALVEAINSIYAQDMTNIDDGLQKAEELLANSKADKKIIVLMSDGEPNMDRCGDDLIKYADEIKKNDTYIYTLGFFDDLGDNRQEAQQLMEKLASEGCHYEVSDADDLVFFFGDIADTISGERFIYVRIACPVDVTVKYKGETLSSSKKDFNTRTDFGSLSFEDNEKSSGSDDTDDMVKILRLKEGTEYDICIEGNGNGKMNYTIGFMDEKGKYRDMREFKNIKITKKTVVDTVADNTKATVLKVDEDGDGRYDYTYKAMANEKGELVSYMYVLWCALGGAALPLVIAIIAAAVSHSKKRKKKANEQFAAY